jgi:hypothetical protein
MSTNKYMDMYHSFNEADSNHSVFSCGLQCAMEVNLQQDRIGRSATSPVDIITEVTFHIEGLQLTAIRLYPNHVEKEYTISGGIEVSSKWFASWNSPVGFSWWKFNNSGTAAKIQITVEGTLNLNYVSKFRKYPNDIASVKDGYIEVHDAEYPHLTGMIRTMPQWDECSLFRAESSRNPTSIIIEPDTIHFTLQKTLLVPTNKEVSFVFCFGGSNLKETALTSVNDGINQYEQIYEDFINTWDSHLRSGLMVETPNLTVNECLLANKLWAFKDTRMAPFGSPFSTDQPGELIPVLTASPDYHGVFANDNVQSAWEWGSLGEDFLPVLRNTIDTLYRFGTPEAVEIDPINATGKPWLQTWELGPKPQWVMGACAYILWSGEHNQALWQGIKKVLGQFFEDDKDNDFLDDLTFSTFPEQPDPGEFNHEMLFVNVFWVQAYRMAALVATFFEEPAVTSEWSAIAQKIQLAVNDKFISPYGYASWINQEHHQHPHPGHNMILPLQYGLADQAQAQITFDTIFSPSLWTEEGMLVSGAAYPMAGDAHVWDFMRWNLIHALFEYNRIEIGLELLGKWAEHEKQHLYQAPEGFPTITGATGKGYSWTSGRMIRAFLMGLCGFQLLPEGFKFTPRLPDSWDKVTINNLPFRGAVYDIIIQHGEHPGTYLNEQVQPEGIIRPQVSTNTKVTVIVP